MKKNNNSKTIGKLAVGLGVLLGAGGLLSSCEEKKAAAEAAAQATAVSAGAAPSQETGQGAASDPVGSKAAPEPDIAPLAHPASILEAVKVLDLLSFPVPEGTEGPRIRSLVNLTYETKKGVKETYEFQKKSLETRRWKEVPGPTLTEEYASGVFQRAGFTVSVSVMPQGPGKAMVVIVNHGNLDLAKLPVPPGTKVVYAGPVSATFETSATLEATIEACSKVLTDAGWEPYGMEGPSLGFKKNAVRLQVTVVAHPAQAGKTSIMYAAQQLPGDIPVPPDAENLRLPESTGKTTYSTQMTKESLAAFYKEALGKSGWTPDKEELHKVDDKFTIVFRNPEKSLIWIDLTEAGGKVSVSILHQTAGELAEEEKRFQEFKKKNEEARKAGAGG